MGWCCVLLLLLLVFALDLFITKTISRKWHKIWLSSYNLMSIVFCYSLCLCFVCLLSVFFLSLHRIHHTKLDWMTKSFIVVGCFFFIFWCAKITHKKLWPRYKKIDIIFYPCDDIRAGHWWRERERASNIWSISQSIYILWCTMVR